jgi:hypothetical protein
MSNLSAAPDNPPLLAARCSLSPHELGLDGFNVGDEYLFQNWGTVVTVFTPRLNYIGGNEREFREAGTIRLVDFRAYFAITGKSAADYGVEDTYPSPTDKNGSETPQDAANGTSQDTI